jgi:hypothetical protein
VTLPAGKRSQVARCPSLPHMVPVQSCGVVSDHSTAFEEVNGHKDTANPPAAGRVVMTWSCEGRESERRTSPPAREGRRPCGGPAR